MMKIFRKKTKPFKIKAELNKFIYLLIALEVTTNRNPFDVEVDEKCYECKSFLSIESTAC